MKNQVKNNAETPNVESLVKRGYLFLEDSEWNKADEYFDKALDINPEYAPAYIGKLCVELRVCREDSLGDYNELRQGRKFDRPLEKYGNFKKALRFAVDGYLKKLNSYDKKIKESFPKTIPQRFTDEFINGEIARLENEIANCDAEIAEKEETVVKALDLARYYGDLIREATQTYGTALDSDHMLQKQQEINFKYAEDAKNRVKEYKEKKAGYETKKQEIEPLAGISCLDRMDGHYNRLVEALQKESTEYEYKNYAEQFRLLEGYKDSTELANECEKAAVAAKYNYLVQAKNRASTEEEYQDLAPQFRAMNDYEDTTELANECDDQYQELKKSRKEQKQREIERKAAQEAEKKAREEQERIEHNRINKERNRINKERIKRAYLGLFLQFGIMIVFFFVLFGTNIMRTITISPLLIMSVGIPLVFGLISHLFRKNICPKLSWGIVFLLIMDVVTSVISGVLGGKWQYSGIISNSIIFVLIIAIPASLMIFKMDWSYSAWKDSWKKRIALVIGGLFVSCLVGEISYSMMAFLIYAILAVPGFIIMIKAENPDYPNK